LGSQVFASGCPGDAAVGVVPGGVPLAPGDGPFDAVLCNVLNGARLFLFIFEQQMQLPQLVLVLADVLLDFVEPFLHHFLVKLLQAPVYSLTHAHRQVVELLLQPLQSHSICLFLLQFLLQDAHLLLLTTNRLFILVIIIGSVKAFGHGRVRGKLH